MQLSEIIQMKSDVTLDSNYDRLYISDYESHLHEYDTSDNVAESSRTSQDVELYNAVSAFYFTNLVKSQNDPKIVRQFPEM